MFPCKRVGIDVTWRCNWRCKHCFYLRNPKFHSNEDVPLEEVCQKIDKGIRGGLNHVVLVGYGEPALCKNLFEILEYAHSKNMSTSMITNGAAPLPIYQQCFELGMDHLHISSHGLGATLDKIVGKEGAFAKQSALKQWLNKENLPFRTNVTLQKDNYEELISLVEYETSMNVRHFVFLGFLPHYEWHNHAKEITIHPAKLRPYLEAAADHLINREIPFTIRYHPLCHLHEDYWKYVVNARYVFFDPWEWNYPLQATNIPALWQASVRCGESVENKECRKNCSAYRHCGGWNRTYAAAYPNVLQPITSAPEQYAPYWNIDGGLHDLNPANHMQGYFLPTEQLATG